MTKSRSGRGRTYKVSYLGLRMVKERTVSLPTETVRTALDAVAIAVRLIADRPIENLIAICLNGRGAVTGVTTLSTGGMTQASITVADVFRAVLAAHASAFILVHNHPSGDPTPSPEDIRFTREIAAAGRIIGVSLLDHLVVVRGGDYRSVEVES